MLWYPENWEIYVVTTSKDFWISIKRCKVIKAILSCQNDKIIYYMEVGNWTNKTVWRN